MTLLTKLATELARPSPALVVRFAEQVAASRPGALAVVHYGATLRGSVESSDLIDFYLIVEDYGAAYGSRWLATANRWLPPNVFPAAHDGRHAKVAVLDRADLLRLTGERAPTVSVWARFCQPLRLAWSRDGEAAALVARAAAASVRTMVTTAAPMEDTGEPLAIWRTGLALTYGAELRAERDGRSDTVLDADAARYRSLARLAADEFGWPVRDGRIARSFTIAAREAEEQRWVARRRRGKVATVLRLAKASATYGGGIEYLASKIERHSGVPVRLRPWQRRAPILGALWLLPSLLRRGAVR